MILRLIIKEIVHRKLNFALSVLALVSTVTLVVAYVLTSRASINETKRVTRDMGFNLRIIPRSADIDEFWSRGYTDETMPESSVERLAGYENVFMSYNHLVASLQRRIDIGGRETILIGVSPAIAAKGKKPMGYSLKDGKVTLGFRVAERLSLKKGGSIEILGETFRVEQALVESGTDEDIKVYGSLTDVQRLLKLEGQINEIKAIDCLCLTSDEDPIAILRNELEKALPEGQVFQIRAIADARAKQRQMGEKFFGLLTPGMMIVSALWIGVLAMLNVRDRTVEIGVLRAIGQNSSRIAGLFLGKSIVSGVVGALMGYFMGTGLAMKLGPDIFHVTKVQTDTSLLLWCLALAPLFAAISAFIPAMMAVAQDPANSLRTD
jgi:putative ABC transport system permease protein